MAKSKENQELVTAPEESAAPAESTAPALEKNEQPDSLEAAPEAPTLFSLEELAEAKRVPGWQSAALHKLMGWEPGKRVSETEYAAALARLKSRRIGG